MDVDPADIVAVTGEQHTISPVKPTSYNTGTRLEKLVPQNPPAGVPAIDSIIPSSVVVHFKGEVLKEDADYLLSHDYGMLGLGPSGKLSPTDPVEIDYSYSLQRLDSLVRGADGKERVVKGVSVLTCPKPPDIGPGDTRLANIFVPYQATGKHSEVFRLLERPDQAKTGTTRNSAPKTLAKLQAGQAVKIERDFGVREALDLRHTRIGRAAARGEGDRQRQIAPALWPRRIKSQR